MISVTITQQDGYYYLWLGNYIYQIYTNLGAAQKTIQKIKDMLDNC